MRELSKVQESEGVRRQRVRETTADRRPRAERRRRRGALRCLQAGVRRPCMECPRRTRRAPAASPALVYTRVRATCAAHAPRRARLQPRELARPACEPLDLALRASDNLDVAVRARAEVGVRAGADAGEGRAHGRTLMPSDLQSFLLLSNMISQNSMSGHSSASRRYFGAIAWQAERARWRCMAGVRTHGRRRAHLAGATPAGEEFDHDELVASLRLGDLRLVRLHVSQVRDWPRRTHETRHAAGARGCARG